MRKTLEGGRPWRERAPLERGALSLQTSLSPENFPQEHPPLYGENLFRYVWAGALGESFLFLGRYFFAECGFAPVLLWGCLEGYPLRRFSPCKKISKKNGTTHGSFPTNTFFDTATIPYPVPHSSKNPHLPPKPKLPHKTPTIKKAKQIFARVMVGVLWGSSRREREVWRERGASFKRSSSPSKVFPFSLQGLSHRFSSCVGTATAGSALLR